MNTPVTAEAPSMMGYMRDQGRALRDTLNRREEFCAPMRELFASHEIERVYFIGSGTSYNAALYIAACFERLASLFAVAEVPTRFIDMCLPTLSVECARKTLVVGISQSGTSVSTVAGIRAAREAGCLTVAVTDATESLITREAEVTVKLTCGVELIPVETRGYVVTLLEGLLMALDTGLLSGALAPDDHERIMNQVSDLAERYDDIFAEVEAWYDANASELLTMERGAIAAYGLNYATAVEGELKLGETFKRPVNSYEMEEMIHGPQMAFEEGTFVFLIASNERGLERVPLFSSFFLDNGITDNVYVIGDAATAAAFDLRSCDLLLTGEVPALLSPLVYTLPFQLIAAKNCIAVGIDTAKRPEGKRSFAHVYNEEQL